ncbi:carbonic anhydrase family protein [Actinobacillus equuli subsp. haemolyticus]|nr:carbonic anhydrase family protein [Actinobacillus equuli subsp. haemolyticus]
MKKHLLLSTVLIALSNFTYGDSHPHWSYEGDSSPSHWGTIDESFKLCQIGKNQSPVDLSQAIASTKQHLTLSSSLSGEYQIENNGHTLQATPTQAVSPIQLDNKQFILKQFHFHTPSEHTFKRKHFPIEAHFVHQSAQGELAVLAVMFKQGEENPALTPLITKILANGESTKNVLNPQQLLPKSQEYFRLNGSLTTPPCSEGVNWVVFKTPLDASKAQIDSMKKIIGQENNRPVQPINSRIVIEENK